MSAISSSLPLVPPAVTLDRHAKSSGSASSRSGPAAANPASAETSAPSAAEATTGLDGVLARIQGQNEASALASLADLDEAMAATQLARQSILTQAGLARAAHAGLTPATALRALED